MAFYARRKANERQMHKDGGGMVHRARGLFYGLAQRRLVRGVAQFNALVVSCFLVQIAACGHACSSRRRRIKLSHPCHFPLSGMGLGVYPHARGPNIICGLRKTRLPHPYTHHRSLAFTTFVHTTRNFSVWKEALQCSEDEASDCEFRVSRYILNCQRSKCAKASNPVPA